MTPEDAIVVSNTLYWGMRLIDGLTFETWEFFASPIAVWMAFISRTTFWVPAEYIPGTFGLELDKMLEICFEYDNVDGLTLTIKDYAILIESFWNARHPLGADNIENVLCLIMKARRKFRCVRPDRDNSNISPLIDAIDDFIYLIED
ncbi:hypothetical protein F5B18DRAFT_89201 [Nemania serpens]|nr:hypothetical protein F5B18DRAFT_89201 [Nemania serpens]